MRVPANATTLGSGATVVTIGTGTYTRVEGAAPVDPDPGFVDISSATVTGVADKTYTGEAQAQSPTVMVAAATLKSATDYTLSYKSNVNAGMATVTITGKGVYAGSVSKTFTIAKAAKPNVRMPQ